jgi:glycosyltransferase involved in cell wall biosynthesis
VKRVMRARDESTSPRVAVVVPCFNDGEYLVEALESLRQQEPVELVVVDDGSEDPRTLRRLDELRNAGVRVIRQENGGLSAARMTGVRHTSAELLHPLDADDRLTPGALTALADALEGDPGAAAAWGDYESFGASSCRFPGAHELDPWRITYIDEICGTSMVRRSALEGVGGWNMGSGFEDWDLWMKLAEAGHRGVYVPMTTLLYRVHDTPRMYNETRARTAMLRQRLRSRHRKLYAQRGANRKVSPSPLVIKALFTIVDGMPALPELRKQQLLALIRYWFQREMASDCFQGVLPRMRRRLRRRSAP